MSTRVVIPARLSSSRLPNKVLADLGGEPVIAHVIRAAQAAALGEVWVVSDAEEVLAVAQAAGVGSYRSRGDHPSGSDRIHELAAAKGWAGEDILVNLQGDEPFMPSGMLRTVAHQLSADPGADWATVGVPLRNLEEWQNPACVKIVRSLAGRALYFSRAPIPHPRDAAGQLPEGALRHIGLYAYRCARLAAWCAREPTPLESLEKLEQLRALELGMQISVAVVDAAPPTGIDTADDLQRARERVGAATPSH
ncbi:MAG: 3-deoxy-manno-octulosonate cytidylyltransferase [Oceanococcaceae bacterium]